MLEAATNDFDNRIRFDVEQEQVSERRTPGDALLGTEIFQKIDVSST
jgi:hypothetical protein